MTGTDEAGQNQKPETGKITAGKPNNNNCFNDVILILTPTRYNTQMEIQTERTGELIDNDNDSL